MILYISMLVPSVLAYTGIGVVVYTLLVEKLDFDHTDAAMISVFWPVAVAASPLLLVIWTIVVGASIFQKGFADWLNRPTAVKTKLPKATARARI